MSFVTHPPVTQGWDVLYAELLEKTWKEKMDEWGKRPKGEGGGNIDP